jgi:hypothetical protein
MRGYVDSESENRAVFPREVAEHGEVGRLSQIAGDKSL